MAFPAVDPDLRAEGREAPRGRRPDPAGGTGDEDPLSG
jgi:hypothetical protein